MNTHETQVDTMLTKLFAGEPVEQLVKEFPELESEIFSYAKTIDLLGKTRALRPKESGLYTALQSVRSLTPRPASTPSPFAFVQLTRYSFMYKSAFVLPLLLVVLVASGAYVLPRLGSQGTTHMPTSDSGVPEVPGGAQSASFSAESASAPTNAVAKTMALAPAPQPTLPQDTTLAAIYGPEISQDVQAVQEDNIQASSLSDDSGDTRGYTDAYDEDAF